MKKLLNILLALAIFLMMPVVHAHDIELDPDDIIKIPVDENNQLSIKTGILVDESFGEYTLSYQYVLMDEDTRESYNTILEEQLEYEEENRPSVDDEESIIDEYKEKMAEYEASKKALRPGYVETNWKESKDGTVPLDAETIKNAKGDEAYVLWVKVTSKEDKTKIVYDDEVVIYQISEEEKSPSTSDNIMIIGVLAVAVVGLMAVSYKKSRA